MASDQINKFIEQINSDPDVQELLKNRPKGDNREDEIKVYTGLAAQLGYTFTEADLKEAVEEKRNLRMEKTEEAAAGIEELSDEVLDRVAGGKDHQECKNTYKDREDCWRSDSCDWIVNLYDNSICAWYYYICSKGPDRESGKL